MSKKKKVTSSKPAVKRTLADLALAFQTDKYEHGYCPYYERHMPGRNEVFSLLEVGVFKGGSLRMWKEWYPRAQIIGVDIDERSIFQEDRISTYLGDGTKEEFWDTLHIPDLRVIIDDGSHMAEDIVKTHKILWPRLQVGGLYVVEDLYVQWNEQWGGDPEKGSPAIEVLNEFMNMLLHTPNPYAFHAYYQIAFLQK